MESIVSRGLGGVVPEDEVGEALKIRLLAASSSIEDRLAVFFFDLADKLDESASSGFAGGVC